MNTESFIMEELERRRISPYPLLDRLFTSLDREQLRRTRNLRLIPNEQDRRGGKYSYAEWAHVIGIFQTVMCLQLRKLKDNLILDIGCGTGLLAIASEPFLGPTGKYIGIDIMKTDVDFCRRHYPAENFEFIHFDARNPAYAPAQNDTLSQWPIGESSEDLVTALSIWTHLREDEATFYFKEISRVLKPKGKAIVTFFLLDALYHKTLGGRAHEEGRYHRTLQDRWIFDQPAYGSDAWLYPKWADIPEMAIGVTETGLERLVSASGLRIKAYYPGNWKEAPGVYFQDIVILEKPCD
jgi:SAM-dependent methyltransferase